jgi:hypothetical protein
MNRDGRIAVIAVIVPDHRDRRATGLELAFKFSESFFQFEFGISFGAVLGQLPAGGARAIDMLSANAFGPGCVRSFALPETVSLQKAVFQAGACELF